jgi:hypothetical protein
MGKNGGCWFTAAKSEIDIQLTYANYYFREAWRRYKKVFQ